MLYYSEKEIAGAIVVDSEGYVAGILEDIKIRGEELTFTIISKGRKRTTLPWSIVRNVKVSELGKCIILKEPIEARRRGIEPMEKPLYCGKEYVNNMLVIDADAKIVGVAFDVIFSITKPPELVVVRAKSIPYKEVDDVDKIVEMLVPSKYPTNIDLYKRVLIDLKMRGRFKAEDVKTRYLPIWARKRGIRVPKKKVLNVDKSMIVRIEWDEISKIGDVILLSRSI